VACFTRGTAGLGWRVDRDAVAAAEGQGDAGVATTVAATLKLLEGDLLSNGLVQPETAFTSRGHIGPAQCQPCHQGAVERWSASRHANAVAILTQRNGLRADCLKCHSTAYAQWSAIRPLGSGPQGVECTTCHEGARRHLASPRAGTIARGQRNVCLSCHTRTTDPTYDEAKRWATIVHGADPKP